MPDEKADINPLGQAHIIHEVDACTILTLHDR